MKQSTKALLAVFVGNSIFGFSFLASRLILMQTDVFVLLSARFLLAFLIMNLLILFKVCKINFKGKNIWGVILLGICQPVAYFICESYGISLTNSSISGTFIAMVPIFAFIFAAFFLREKITLSQSLWGICSVSGVVIISVGNGSDTSVTLIGVLLLIGAVISGALFNVVSKKTSSEFTPFERTYIMFALGSVVFTICAIFQTQGRLHFILSDLIFKPSFTLSILFLSVMSSVIAFLLLNYATTYIAVRQTSIFSCLTTVVSIIAGVIFLDEPFGGIRQIIGSALILLGVYMVSIANTDKKQD